MISLLTCAKSSILIFTMKLFSLLKTKNFNVDFIGAVYVSIGRFNCVSMHAVELWSTLKLSKKLNGEDYLAAA